VIVKRLAKRSRALVIAHYLLNDLRARLAERDGVASGNSETGGGGLTADETVAYAKFAFSSMLRHAGLNGDGNALAGKRVLEIGPGDTQALGLVALEHGAAEAVGLERFALRHDAARQQAINNAMGSSSAISLVVGIGIEDAVAYFGTHSFDVIFSVAVLEHVSDLDAAFAAMNQLLRPGGVMLHQIGGGDHGMFTDGGHHPLTYMTVPSWLYRLMTQHSGLPNRVLPTIVRRVAERYDWDWRLTISNVLGAKTFHQYVDRVDPRAFPDQVALAEKIRPRLREPFRSLPASELITCGTFLSVRKPDAVHHSQQTWIVH
jgi:SAM-dependent methyltransferase